MRFRSALLVPALVATAALTGCVGEDPTQPSVPATETFAPSLGIDLSTFTKFSDDLYYKDEVVGTGATATTSKLVSVTYTLWLKDGTQIESNVGQDLFQFTLGKGQVITGWDVGISGMKVGGKRKLVVGSAYGYGARGTSDGKVPSHATLIFEVELKQVQ